MASRFLAVVLLGAASASGLLAVGCASSNENPPYGLTGDSRDQVDQQHQEWLQKQQYTDQKGHYHQEWDPANHSYHQ